MSIEKTRSNNKDYSLSSLFTVGVVGAGLILYQALEEARHTGPFLARQILKRLPIFRLK